jgi:hypothetical protein
MTKPARLIIGISIIALQRLRIGREGRKVLHNEFL